MSKHKKISIVEFTRRYSTEEACREHLAEHRWPDGFMCPCCGNAHAHRLSNGRYQCSKCRHQTSVTAGTFMHRSHVSLRKWFLAFYFVTQDKRGVSATQLSFLIGVTYKTAWFMLFRIRKAMGQRDEQYLLEGIGKALLSLMILTLADLLSERNGAAVQKKQKHLLHCHWIKTAIQSFLKWG